MLKKSYTVFRKRWSGQRKDIKKRCNVKYKDPWKFFFKRDKREERITLNFMCTEMCGNEGEKGTRAELGLMWRQRQLCLCKTLPDNDVSLDFVISPCYQPNKCVHRPSVVNFFCLIYCFYGTEPVRDSSSEAEAKDTADTSRCLSSLVSVCMLCTHTHTQVRSQIKNANYTHFANE